MADLEVLWSDIVEVFPLLNGKIGGIPAIQNVNTETYKNISRQLANIDTLQMFNEVLELEIRSAVRLQIVPKFWKYFALEPETVKLLEDTSAATSIELTEIKHKLFEQFVVAVNELFLSFQYLEQIHDRLKNLNSFINSQIEMCRNVMEPSLVQKIFRDSLLSQLPPHFNSIVDAFYWLYFKLFSKMQFKNSLAMDADIMLNELLCVGCNYAVDKCCCQNIAQVVNGVNSKLLNMQLLDRLGGTSMTNLVKIKIKEHIADACHGIFDRSHLKQLEAWLNNVIINWLTCIYSGGQSTASVDSMSTQEVIDGFKVKLTYFMYEKFAHSVIDQFFSIIIDFPDSIPAIDDLKICMEKIDMRTYLTKTLRKSLQARILHPGVNTMDILTGYVAAIKTIRHLDNSGVILEMVTAPIKEYLRKRSDTVRRVVTGLTEEGPTDLSEELAKGEALKDPKDPNNIDDFSNWENWQPDPFGIDPSTLNYNSSKVMRSADIISMVVDIYGSKELFMVEYRNLMADRLLTQLDFNSEKEIRNLELLKIRFGETLLHSCEVMLKDVTDSKRINSHIHGDTNYNDNKLFDISTLTISAQFWPSFNKENLELPEEIENEFKKFTKSYEAYKGNRTLNWRTVTGRVNLVVEIGDRTLELTVPPTQAVIIYHFQTKPEWSLDELSAVTKVPPSALRRRISFWQNNGLISETQLGIFALNEEKPEKPFVASNITENYDEDLESAMASASDQREEELQVFWSYIVGMLTNLDSLPIERIHQMLKLFASHSGGIEFTQDELKHFLQRKVREHKLLFSGGVYQLAK